MKKLCATVVVALLVGAATAAAQQPLQIGVTGQGVVAMYGNPVPTDWNNQTLTVYTLSSAQQAAYTALLKTACCGISFDGTNFAAIAAPPPSPQQQYAAAVAAGLTITWQTSTTLNATYPLGNDPITQTPIAVEALAELGNIGAKGTFISGQTTRNWPDVTGTPHAMTVAQFQAMYGACAAYLDALATALGAALLPNGTWVPPSATVTLDQ